MGEKLQIEIQNFCGNAKIHFSAEKDTFCYLVSAALCGINAVLWIMEHTTSTFKMDAYAEVLLLTLL